MLLLLLASFLKLDEGLCHMFADKNSRFIWSWETWWRMVINGEIEHLWFRLLIHFQRTENFNTHHVQDSTSWYAYCSDQNFFHSLKQNEIYSSRKLRLFCTLIGQISCCLGANQFQQLKIWYPKLYSLFQPK